MAFSFQRLESESVSDFYKKFEGPKTFLQGTSFGAFRHLVGETIFYYGLFEDDHLVGTVLIQQVKTRLKTFLHMPHGPLLPAQNTEAWKFLLQAYVDLGRQKGCDFVRISPLLPVSHENILRLSKFKPAPVHLVNPERTWVLDLTQSEEAMLAAMRKSTRYEVRRIAKTGIEVTMGCSSQDLDRFWDLHEATVARQGFVPFPKSNTERQMEAFGEDCQIFTASVEGEDGSSCVIVFDDHAAYYHQGASKPHKLPVAHAPLWSAIREAKARGCEVFNFWGVVAENQTTHPWFGLSRFKRGFGGSEQVFLHAHDFPITWKYHLSAVIEKWRKWRKGY